MMTGESGTAQKSMHVRGIIHYSEGGYFGDGDVLTYLSGLSKSHGRDSTCMGDMETTIFVMGLREIKKIRD